LTTSLHKTSALVEERLFSSLSKASFCALGLRPLQGRNGLLGLGPRRRMQHPADGTTTCRVTAGAIAIAPATRGRRNRDPGRPAILLSPD
jgi:hypothetical protein